MDGCDPRITADEETVKSCFLGSEAQRLHWVIADNGEKFARCDTLNRHLTHKMSKNIAQIVGTPGWCVTVEPAGTSVDVVVNVVRTPEPLLASPVACHCTLHDL